MSKEKYFYYVGVKNNYGLTLVTKKDCTHRMCFWDDKMSPLKMPKRVAEDTALGLNLNGSYAVVIQSHTELNEHFLVADKLLKEKEDCTAREIKGTVYRLTYVATYHTFVECRSKEELFKYIAKEAVNGQCVTSVNEMCKDGRTPKVAVFTDKEFKKILKQTQKEKEGK